jgi:hypothetical protein
VENVPGISDLPSCKIHAGLEICCAAEIQRARATFQLLVTHLRLFSAALADILAERMGRSMGNEFDRKSVTSLSRLRFSCFTRRRCRA